MPNRTTPFTASSAFIIPTGLATLITVGRAWSWGKGIARRVRERAERAEPPIGRRPERPCRTTGFDFGGVEGLGSYGVSFLIESPFIPAGYVVVAASGGPGANQNVVGFREHPDPAR